MNISLFTILIVLTAQTGTNSAPAVSLSYDKPVISVSGQGTSTTTFTTSEYQITLYADTAAGTEAEAKALAETMRQDIIKAVKEMGGKESDVVLSNINNVPPYETDPLYRINQDLYVTLRNVKDINKVREKFLLTTTAQIGSVMPVAEGKIDYGPAVAEARTAAMKNARDEASSLAQAANVILGEPLYISEQITYPYYYNSSEYGDYGGSYGTDSTVTVQVTVYYLMIYKK
ncbi:MAG TPA: SIMPL domain-containing protein [bacterium]